MTSEEIKQELEGCRANAQGATDAGHRELAWKHIHDAPLWEIAYQFAVMNEKGSEERGIDWNKVDLSGLDRIQKLVDAQPGKRDAESSAAFDVTKAFGVNVDICEWGTPCEPNGACRIHKLKRLIQKLVAGKRDAASSAWPLIQPYGGMRAEKIGKYQLWMHPGAAPKIFDTEEQAKEYLRGMAKRMNDYEPGKRDADSEPGANWKACAVQECSNGPSFQVCGIQLCYTHFRELSITNKDGMSTQPCDKKWKELYDAALALSYGKEDAPARDRLRDALKACADKLADPEPGKRDAASSAWPLIQPYGGMRAENIGKYQLWLHPGATPLIFDTEEQAKQYVREMGERMNQYQPGEHGIYHPFHCVTQGDMDRCARCGASEKAAVHIRQGSRASELSTETGSTPKKESL